MNDFQKQLVEADELQIQCVLKQLKSELFDIYLQNHIISHHARTAIAQFIDTNVYKQLTYEKLLKRRYQKRCGEVTQSLWKLQTQLKEKQT